MRSLETNLTCAAQSTGNRLMAMLAVFALLLLQAAPLVAAGSKSDEWVEICSEFGAIMVQVDFGGEDDTPADSCPDCAQCPFCATVQPGTLPTLPQELTSGNGAQKPVFLSAQTTIENPAQFWPDNRGPPLEAAIKQARACIVSRAASANLGDATWQ